MAPLPATVRPVQQHGHAVAPASGRMPHVHWFRWAGDDPVGNAGRYACRCGIVRPGL